MKISGMSYSPFKFLVKCVCVCLFVFPVWTWTLFSRYQPPIFCILRPPIYIVDTLSYRKWLFLSDMCGHNIMNVWWLPLAEFCHCSQLVVEILLLFIIAVVPNLYSRGLITTQAARLNLVRPPPPTFSAILPISWYMVLCYYYLTLYYTDQTQTGTSFSFPAAIAPIIVIFIGTGPLAFQGP